MKKHCPKKRPMLIGKCKLQYDNARPHMANIATEFLISQNNQVYMAPSVK